jgi:hypothetical protein
MAIIDPFEQSSEVSITDPFEGIIDPFASEEQPRSLRGKNTVANSLQDIVRLLLPAPIAGIQAIGTGVGQAAAGGNFLEGAVEGAQKEDFLGFGMGMETSAGKWVEDKLGRLFTAAREFGGEQAPKMLTSETARTAMKSFPGLAPLALLYEGLDDAGKTTMEAALSAGGAAGPEVLLTLIGGRGASKLAKGKDIPDVDTSIGDILKTLEKEATPEQVVPEQPRQIGGLAEDFLTPDERAQLHQKAPDWTTEGKQRPTDLPEPSNLIEFEKVDPATLKKQTDDLFPAQMEETQYKPYATPEQGIEHIQRIPTDVTPVKGEPGQFDLPGINQPLGGVGKKGFGQGGAVDFWSMSKIDEDGPRVNASGESAASLEAQSRLRSMNEQGIKMFEVDPERNVLIPLNTADRVDKRPAQGRAIVQVDKDGKMSVVENNSRLPNEGLIGRTQRQLAMESSAKESPKPLGGTGRKGFGQGGAIGFKSEPKSLEAQAKTLPKEDWIAEFNKQYPDKTQFAEQVYNTLQPKRKEVRPSDNAILKALDKGLGSLSTRIGNISQPLLHRAIVLEKDILSNTHKRLTAIDDFSLELNTLPKNVRDLLDNAILNNNQKVLDGMFDQLGGNLKKNYYQARKALDEVGSELKSVGKLEGLRRDYFPRIVTDVDGLLAALGKENRTDLERRLLKASSPLEESEIINNYLRTSYKGPYKAGFTKSRTLEEVPPELQQYYANPTEAYHTYMRNATQEIETAKFFGKDAIRDPETRRLDIGQSIGNLVLKELEDGKITIKQAEELQSMLQSRFGPGNKASAGFVQDMKNMGYMGLLGDAVAAATQLGDPAVSVFLNDLRPTLMAVGQQLVPSKRKVKMEDFGLFDHISEEFVNERKSAALLNKVFKLGLFSTVDKFGKNVILNAALNQSQKLVKSPAGLRRFADEWQPRFGDEFPQLVEDLKRGEMTEPVRTLLFSKLSQAQPISKLEMPQKYLDMPNGRVLYMLKTFTLKQVDLMRNKAYNEIKRGNTAKGLENLAKYGLVMGLAGATTEQVKNWMLGRELSMPDMEDVAGNMLKTFGLSEYILSQAKRGEVGKSLLTAVTPPITMYDDVGKALKASLDGDPDTEPDWGKAFQRFPLIGRLWYSRFLGGAEEFNQKQLDKEFKEMMED